MTLDKTKDYHFELELQVRDYECDIQGIVNNAVYQNYLEHCRHKFLNHVGLDFAELHKEGIDAVVIKAELDYKFPLRPGDVFLIGFAKANFSKEQQEEIQNRADKIQTRLQDLKKEEILNTKNACPFLENNSCSIYDVRPMACRIYLSTNLDSCRRFYQQPEDESNYPALLDFPMRAGRMMNEGFKSALKTKGITARELRIDQLVL